jgi:carboxyl-terminal processing protease
MTVKAFKSANHNHWGISRLTALFFIGLAGFVVSCKEDEVLSGNNNVVSAENQYVNKWILQNMQDWYLWNAELPSDNDENLDPSEYFSELLSAEDRFSWLQPNYEELINSLQGINKEGGYEFVLYKESSNSENVIAQILYVKPDSPAENAGLKRGDVITKINGEVLTTNNYKDLIQDLKANHSLEYKPILTGEDKFGNLTSVQLSVVEYSENPNYLYKIFTEGDRKIGYYVYNFFASGISDDGKEYDEQMENIFSQFKTEGITDLVLDLRFNSGGSEGSARNLASLIGKGISSSDLFFSRVYNDDVMEEIETNPELGDAYLKSFFLDKASNIGSQLGGGRVYILTSSRTASASELIINSLNPYMDVFLIGDVTYGKNVGSISIYEEDDPKNTWGLQPIIVKVSNSVGFSDYGDGFTPDIEDKDNSIYLYPLGDTRENLLAQAIAHITGVADPGRVRASEISRPVIGHSLDAKRRGFSLILDQSSLR